MLRDIQNWIANSPRPLKRIGLVGFDAVALAGAVWLSYALRFNTMFRPSPEQWLLILAAPVIAIPVFIRLGLYRAVIRYLPERAIWTMLQAASLAALLWVGLVFLLELSGNGIVPRTVPLFYWGSAAAIVIGSRFAAKHLIWAPREGQLQSGQILIYGAGEAGSQLAAALRHGGRGVIAGFLDDNPSLHGRDIAGIRVYSPGFLPNLIENYGIEEIILSMPSLDNRRRQEIVTALSTHKVRIRTLPHIADLLSGKYALTQIREIDIDELLGRSSVSADLQLIDTMIEGRAILVTGAGGSIGAELCRLIMRGRPKVLVLFEQNEFALYSIHRELLKIGKGTPVPVLASIADRAALAEAITTHDIKVLFHAAAHKHVPMVEANAIEGMRNNVFGSFCVTETAFELGLEHFVLISSDKAVRPTNVMGATKRWAELIMRHFAIRAALAGTGQKFCAVRFGNVLGSNGSVVPLFKEQIAEGGPVTLTDPAMTRYFMSIHEAAELIVQAGALSAGDDIFLLEMGEPVRILDLARNMVALAGHSVRDAANPDGTIALEITGARPGEKLFEELFYDPASATPTSHAKILRARTGRPDPQLEQALHALERALEDRDEERARQLLFRFVERTAPPPHETER